MNAITRLDKTLREFVLLRDHEFEAKLRHDLPRAFVVELIARWQKAGRLVAARIADRDRRRSTSESSGTFGARFAAGAAQEDVNRLVQKIAERLSSEGTVKLTPELFRRRRNDLQRAWDEVGELLGAEKPTFFTSLLDFIQRERESRWIGRLPELNREIFDRAVGAFDWYCLEELQKAAQQQGLWTGPSVSQSQRHVEVVSRKDAARKSNASRSASASWTALSPNDSCFGRRRKRTSSRRWTARCKFPAGETSGRSPSSTASTCSPPAFAR